MMCERHDIWVPPFKEQHFFDHKFIPKNRGWIKKHLLSSVDREIERHIRKNTPPDEAFLAYIQSLTEKPVFNGNWYKRVFSQMPDQSIGMDITPEYSILPEEGVDFIRTFLKTPKVIFFLRDPVDRAKSALRMFVGRRSLAEFPIANWEVDLLKKGEVIEKSSYSKFLPIWERIMGRENILLIDYRDVKENPSFVITEIESFLGLDSFHHSRLGDTIYKSPELDLPQEVTTLLEELLDRETDYFNTLFPRKALT